MKNRMIITLFIVIAALLAGAQNNKQDPFLLRNSVDFCPLSPVMGIYAIHYTHKFTPRDALILGPSYMRIEYKNIGNTNAPGIIVGYRRYLWKNLHVDYQLMPMFDRY